MLQLRLGVDRLALATHGILRHNHDNRTVVHSVHDSDALGCRESGNGSLTNTSDVNTAVLVDLHDLHIIAKHSSIGTTVDEGTSRRDIVVMRHAINNITFASVDLSIQHHTFCISGSDSTAPRSRTVTRNIVGEDISQMGSRSIRRIPIRSIARRDSRGIMSRYDLYRRGFRGARSLIHIRCVLAVVILARVVTRSIQSLFLFRCHRLENFWWDVIVVSSSRWLVASVSTSASTTTSTTTTIVRTSATTASLLVSSTSSLILVIGIVHILVSLNNAILGIATINRSGMFHQIVVVVKIRKRSGWSSTSVARNHGRLGLQCSNVGAHFRMLRKGFIKFLDIPGVSMNRRVRQLAVVLDQMSDFGHEARNSLRPILVETEFF